MHFLCFHGKGTSSMMLEAQLGAIRYQLGDNHSYEFVEGTVAEEITPELKDFYPSESESFGYFDENSAESCLNALQNVERYINTQGPFDGIIAFSQGAALISTLLVRYLRRHLAPMPVKVAIFFSGGVPADPDKLEQGLIEPMSSFTSFGMINIPTAHIWGKTSCGELDWPPLLRDMCSKEIREEFEHDGGHEIPSSKDRAAVTRAVQVMRRTIWRAEIMRREERVRSSRQG